jgi:YggT family protein
MRIADERKRNPTAEGLRSNVIYEPDPTVSREPSGLGFSARPFDPRPARRIHRLGIPDQDGKACPRAVGTLHVNGCPPPAALHLKTSMRALLDVIILLLNLYIYVVIAAALFSWLMVFGVVNTRNPFVATVGEFLYRITEPVLRPIRSVLPNLGGIDISPIVLFLIIILIERVIEYYIYPNVF